jgi:glycine cleavage system H lipoate-binding protein
MVNTDPLGRGWLFRIRLSSPDELKQLLDFQAYDRPKLSRHGRARTPEVIP